MNTEIRIFTLDKYETPEGNYILEIFDRTNMETIFATEDIELYQEMEAIIYEYETQCEVEVSLANEVFDISLNELIKEYHDTQN